jgi:hypothetical protein
LAAEKTYRSFVWKVFNGEFLNLLENRGFIASPHGSPPKPTDTVTTPLSVSTEKEAAQPSPAAKN